MPHSFTILNLESVEREKIIKTWKSREQKDLFRWNIKHFSYKGLSVGKKNKK